MLATNVEVRAARDAKLQALKEHLASAVDQLVSGGDWRHALEFVARLRSRPFGIGQARSPVDAMAMRL